MPRIFLTLAILSTLVLIAVFLMGLGIGDPTARDAAVQRLVSYHVLAGVSGLVFTSLVHALVLTYFMGTGRWMEETITAYSLPDDRLRESRALKYRTIPALFGAFVLLLIAGAFGSAADPASHVGFDSWLGMSASTVHFLSVVIALSVNLMVMLWEYAAISRNAELIAEVLAEVRRMRSERGLPV